MARNPVADERAWDRFADLAKHATLEELGRALRAALKEDAACCSGVDLDGRAYGVGVSVAFLGDRLEGALAMTMVRVCDQCSGTGTVWR